MNVIHIEQLYKKFGMKEVLKGISLDVESGEILGVLGPSGAGKTTMVEILIGHLAHDAGISQVFGVDSHRLHDDLYRKIGAVLDETGLFERLSCIQNLEVYRKIYQLPKAAVYDALYKVGLQDHAKLSVLKLSKGMKQRLVLARAIMHKPALLFLDEPTSGLDPSTAKLIHQRLLDLKKAGTTILLVTHNMQEASDLCDHVAFLFNGEIIEYGTVSSICIKHDALKSICVETRQGTMQLPNQKNHYPKLSQILAEQEIISIHSSEPTLGDVFIALTGKELV